MLADVWAKTLVDSRRSPQMDDLAAYGVPVDGKVYQNRFGCWKKALLAASRITDSGEFPEIDFLMPRPRLSRRTRFLVFQRDKSTCRICNETEGKLEIDHIVPYSQGGSEKMENLQVLCQPCNRGKGKSTQ